MPDTLPVAERMFQDPPIQPEIIEHSIVNEGTVSPDAAVMDSDGVNQEPEQVFRRAHSDGQEFSGTLEQARKVCPALGRMSVENARATLQEEDLAARVAQRGREKRQTETAKVRESKARSDEPVNSERDSKKPQDKHMEHVDDSRRIAETTSPALQDGQMREAAQRTAVTPKPVTTRQSKDTSNHPPDPQVHDLFLRQAEAVRLSQVANETRDEPVTIAEDEVVKAAGLATEVNRQQVDEVSKMARHTEEITRRTAESVEEVMVVRAIDEGEAQPLFVEEISELGAVQPDALEQLPPEYFVNEASQTEIPMSLDEPFYEAADSQNAIEPQHLAMTEENELVEEQGNTTGYELLREDEAIWLMADFEQSKAEVDEVEDQTLDDILATDPADTDVLRITLAESQAVVSVPELPSPVKEIEAAITQLAEALEFAEVDETQEVCKILEKNITLPDVLEASSNESEETVEGKLEVLFIRLFEQTGVDYTPELVESFVKLTQAHYLKELLPITIETEDYTQTLPDEIGTREFLQKLQHGLSAMKRAVTHFYEIGKSVMRLYSIMGNDPQYETI